MPILESLVTKLAVDFIKWLGGQGIDYLSKSDHNDYEIEVRRIIRESAETYKQKYGETTTSGKTHFCSSEVILLELMKFRLSRNPKAEEVNKAIQSDPRIETPTEEEMSRFLEIFSENIKV